MAESQAKSEIDCTRLSGRMREICEGKSGLPAEVEARYREKWAKDQKPLGLGDTVRRLIDRWVPKWMKPKGKCGACEKRREALNKLVPYGTAGNDAVK